MAICFATEWCRVCTPKTGNICTAKADASFCVRQSADYRPGISIGSSQAHNLCSVLLSEGHSSFAGRLNIISLCCVVQSAVYRPCVSISSSQVHNWRGVLLSWLQPCQGRTQASDRDPAQSGATNRYVPCCNLTRNQKLLPTFTPVAEGRSQQCKVPSVNDLLQL